MFAKGFNIEPSYINVFEHEALFADNLDKYWIPVQKEWMNILREEVKKGEMVNLYIIVLGTYRLANSAEIEWVMLVNDFQK